MDGREDAGSTEEECAYELLGVCGGHIFICKLKEPEIDPLGNESDEFTIWVDKDGRTVVEPK